LFEALSASDGAADVQNAEAPAPEDRINTMCLRNVESLASCREIMQRGAIQHSKNF